MFNGKIHYFDWAIFNSYVSLPEGSMTWAMNKRAFSIGHEMSWNKEILTYYN